MVSPSTTLSKVGEARGRGRPRSERARQAILDATARLIVDVGYEALTIDAIATTAGVGRQTIYRWWPSKSSITAEAVTSRTLGRFPPPRASGTLRDLLTAWVNALRDPANAALVRALAAAAASETSDAEALYESVTRTSHAALADAVRRAQTDGTISADTDPTTAADTYIGALLYRVLARLELPVDYANQLLHNDMSH